MHNQGNKRTTARYFKSSHWQWLLLSGCLMVAHQSAEAFDLNYAYQQALTYNAEYLKTVASSEAGNEAKNIARATLFPQISVGAGVSENYFNGMGAYALYYQPLVTAQISQVVFDYSKFSAYSKGKYATELSGLQLQDASQQLFVSVSKAYFDVLYAKDTLKSVQMTKVALEQQYQQAKKEFAVGTVTIADVNDAKAGFDSAFAQEISATNTLIDKKNVFRNLSGLDPEQIASIKEQINLAAPQPENSEHWSQLAESKNFNIKMAAKQVQMANEDVNIAISGHLPTVNAVGQYQIQDTATIHDTNASPEQMQQFTVPGSPLSNYSVGSLGLQLNLPIFSGGGVNANVRQSRAGLQVAQQQLLNVQRETDQNTRNTFWQMQNGVDLVNAQATALKSAKTKLDSDRLGYKVGVRNSVNLVDSQKNYYNTYQIYQQSRYQYLLAAIQLRYLTSSIDSKFIQSINTNIQTID